MTRPRFGSIAAVAASLCLLAPTTVAAERYLVVFRAERVDSGHAAAAVAAAGGVVERGLFHLGLALVRSDDPGFVGRLAARPQVDSVTADRPRATSRAADAEPGVETLAAPGAGPESLRPLAPPSGLAAPPSPLITDPTVLLNAAFYPLQWDLRRIQADLAWLAGHLGAPEVTVAVLDSGIDYTHPELAGRVDLDRSVNLVPADAAQVQALFPGAHPIADLGIHGSYVSSLIACNAFSMACGAPNVTLVGVKVHGADEMAAPGDLVSGIDYAASIGADVIVISFRLATGRPNDPEDRPVIQALRRALHRARAMGSLVLAPALSDRGPIGIDADADGNDVLLPAQAGAVTVGATGTEDQWSGLTSFGFSLVDLAGPGGQVDPVTGMTPPGVFVFSVGVCSSFTQSTRFPQLPGICNKNSPPRYITSIGARPALSHVASVAALVDSRHGGRLRGQKLLEHLAATADDVLAPGPDPFSGAGRVNAYTAATAPLVED